MTLPPGITNWVIKKLCRILCRVDDSQLAKVPPKGPLILVVNHVNFLDVPITYTHLLPRPLTGLVKTETWNHPLLGPLFKLWEGIPIRRGEADLTALRQGLEALAAGKILAIAPEGTRSGHGRLQRAHPGVVTLALKSGAPLLPLVYFGGEQFHDNFRRLRRTDFQLVVGQIFTLDVCGKRVTADLRQQIADEIMCQLAALLPPAYRGVYADLLGVAGCHLRFLSESKGV